MDNRGSLRWVAASASVLVILAGCSKGASEKPSQVAVKVDKDEITVLQFNEQISRIPAGAPADQIEEGKRRALRSLVNRQLFVQQAIERKLDRDPEVLGAIEAARHNLLAQAYVARVIAPQAKPTDQEIREYYAANSDLFANRKVYRLQELSLAATPEQAQEIQSSAAGMHNLQQLGAWLRDHKLPFSVDSGVRTAEQLPLAILPKVAALKVGELFLYQPSGGGGVNALEVLAERAEPVDEKKAAPSIEAFLTNVKREKLAADEVKRLEKAAKIEYVGDFAKYAGEGPLAAPAASAAAAPAAEKPAAKDDAKGIAGLLR